MDMTLRTPHMPAAGETVQGLSLSYAPGGKGANQAVAAARLGAQVAMVTRVGNDPAGPAVRCNLVDAGIDAMYVLDTPTEPQGIAVILVDDAGQNSIVLAAGSNGAISPDDVDACAAAFQGAQVTLLQNEIRMETTLRAAQLAKAAGATVIWNPAPAPKGWPREMAGLVDIVIPNESETERLTGLPVTDAASRERAAEALLAMGFGTVVLTLGGEGALWVDGACSFQAPTFQVDVVDTTAAGDTFCGALAVALAEGQPKPAAVRFACAAAALAVTKMGAQAGIPTRPEVEALLAR
jgi:ribokinase